MNGVTGKKAVFGHCFVNVKILQLSFSLLGLSYLKLQRCTLFFLIRIVSIATADKVIRRKKMVFQTATVQTTINEKN